MRQLLFLIKRKYFSAGYLSEYRCLCNAVATAILVPSARSVRQKSFSITPVCSSFVNLLFAKRKRKMQTKYAPFARAQVYVIDFNLHITKPSMDKLADCTQCTAWSQTRRHLKKTCWFLLVSCCFIYWLTALVTGYAIGFFFSLIFLFISSLFSFLASSLLTISDVVCKLGTMEYYQYHLMFMILCWACWILHWKGNHFHAI